MEFIPNIERLGNIFALATAPAFFLGTIAAFISIMSSRLAQNVERLRNLRSFPNPADGQTEYDRLLRRRVHLLHSGIRFSLLAGIAATALLALLFTTEFIGLNYAYGAGILFITANILLAAALMRFAQEVWIGLAAWDIN